MKGTNNMIKCGLCGKEFEDTQFEEYGAHVSQCASEHSLKKKTEDMKKIQTELEEVKRAKTVYEGLRDTFKEKYPDIYKINFEGAKIDDTNKKDIYSKLEKNGLGVDPSENSANAGKEKTASNSKTNIKKDSLKEANEVIDDLINFLVNDLGFTHRKF